MRQAFLSISFKNRKQLDLEIGAIKKSLGGIFDLVVFVDKYEFGPNEERKMMQQTCKDIRNSVLLLAEVSDKAIGVGIEIGYAIALNIPVIYMRQATAEYSKTVGGIVDNHIIYRDAVDLECQLIKALAEIKSDK